MSAEALSKASSNEQQKDFNEGVDDGLLDELPAFERHEESTAIELFYDLFFVANLTTFSNIHEINSPKTLTSYVGFFCILWFTWCITSLYDIRFVTDSLVSRMAKGVHLGVMVGLAVLGPKFDTTKLTPQLKVIALILMVSRLVLALQYFLVMYHVRQYKKTKLPLSLMGGLNFVAGILYLGISFAFKTSAHAYRALYVIAGFEMVVNIGISWQWKVLTFKGTHLIERMTLLTLYILGEGVIDVLKSVARISEKQDTWTSANIGTLFGAIAAIYLLYMLYFDTLNRHHFGSFRQQLWSFLHFPFHVALVLCLSGMAQFIIWQKIMEVFIDFTLKVEALPSPFVPGAVQDNSTAEDFMNNLYNVSMGTLSNYQASNFSELTELNETVTQALEGIRNVTELYFETHNSELLQNEFKVQIGKIVQAVWNSIMDFYGFEAGSDTPESGDDVVDFKLVASLNTASLIFVFFFVATGFTLIFTGVLGIVNVRSYNKWSWVRFATHLLFGLAMCLLSLLCSGDGTAAINITSTAWPLPIVAMTILIVLTIHHISWEDEEAEIATGKKKYHFLPRWRPNRHGST